MAHCKRIRKWNLASDDNNQAFGFFSLYFSFNLLDSNERMQFGLVLLTHNLQVSFKENPVSVHTSYIHSPTLFYAFRPVYCSNSLDSPF